MSLAKPDATMRALAAAAVLVSTCGLLAASCVQGPAGPDLSASPGAESPPIPGEVGTAEKVGEVEEPLPEDLCAAALERALQICATRLPGLQKACVALAWTAYVACVFHE